MTSDISIRTAETLAELLNEEIQRMKQWTLGNGVSYTTQLKTVHDILEFYTAIPGVQFLNLKTEITDASVSSSRAVQFQGTPIASPMDYFICISSELEKTIPKNSDEKIHFSFMLSRYLSERAEQRRMYGVQFVCAGNADNVPRTFGCILDLGAQKEYKIYLKISEIKEVHFSATDNSSTPLVDV